LRDALALRSEELSTELAERHFVVPWDRQRLIGQVQQALWSLSEERFALATSEGVRVIERAAQPYECIEAAWRALRHGQRVFVDREGEACLGGVELLRAMGEVLGYGVLRVAEAPGMMEEELSTWEEVGVDPAPRRVIAVDADADPELAAYVVARAALRRTGFDPRCVHRVLVAGEQGRFERHLRRLFVGVRIGDPQDTDAFAGPVRPEQAEAFESDLADWREGSGIAELCPGGRLEAGHGASEQVFLAPALFVADGEELRGPQRDPRGPTLILQRVAPDDLESLLRQTLDAVPGPSAWIWISESKPRIEAAEKDRWISGALEVARLPPGLPLPRP
jgi:hypothetical protein